MREDRTSNFELIKMIGEGSYGKVYRSRDRSTGQIVAIKIVNISKMDKIGIQSSLNEIRILNSLNSQYIVGYIEAFMDKQDTRLWLVMEYVGGGDLSTAIKNAKRDRRPFDEKTLWNYMIQSLQALSILAKNKIIHRDIKPANIFLTEDLKTIKLGDLNVSKITKNDLTRTQIGTPSYLAPEVWENKPYDSKCDIFSLGVCLYEMACLRLPFDARSLEELKKKIKNGYFLPLPSHLSEDLKSIILRCMTKKPSDRPSAMGLLEHPVVKQKSREFKIDEKVGNDNELLASIVLPRNISLLNDKLPKKNSKRIRSFSDNNTPDSGAKSANNLSKYDIELDILLKEIRQKRKDIEAHSMNKAVPTNPPIIASSRKAKESPRAIPINKNSRNYSFDHRPSNSVDKDSRARMEQRIIKGVVRNEISKKSFEVESKPRRSSENKYMSFDANDNRKRTGSNEDAPVKSGLSIDRSNLPRYDSKPVAQRIIAKMPPLKNVVGNYQNNFKSPIVRQAVAGVSLSKYESRSQLSSPSQKNRNLEIYKMDSNINDWNKKSVVEVCGYGSRRSSVSALKNIESEQVNPKQPSRGGMETPKKSEGYLNVEPYSEAGLKVQSRANPLLADKPLPSKRPIPKVIPGSSYSKNYSDRMPKNGSVREMDSAKKERVIKFDEYIRNVESQKSISKNCNENSFDRYNKMAKNIHSYIN